MYFWDDRDVADRLCKLAVETGIVDAAKYNNKDSGVACFYLHIDDIHGHRNVIDFFLEHDMIRRTKAGKLYNIPFKLDDETRSGLYTGTGFEGQLKLADLMNLETGQWIAS